MAVVIPDETLYAAHLTAAELKQELAVLLFERDRLTLMQAAELAEMRPIPFQHLLASRGIRPVVNRPLEDSLRLELDPGEAEAIACAVEANAKPLLIDERRGRMVALPRGRSVGAWIGNHQGAKRPSEHERRRVVPPLGQNIA